MTSACPCANFGGAGRGCDNSIASGGASLSATGTTSPDALVLRSAGEPASALSIFLQGNAVLVGGAPFGDGIRCIGGTLKRIAARSAAAGVAVYPQSGDPSISSQSAAFGDALAPGSTRYYQVHYRDSNLGFCPPPSGASFNASNGQTVVW